jgi:signal transduction histidine kinase/CheY-like chemotaxis protein/ligand-binding sensor domain-containing protein
VAQSVAAQPASEAGLPLVQTFEGIVSTTQVLAADQGPDGLIYVGSPQGLLVYDGVRWEQVDLYGDIPQTVALDVGPDGRVWAGAREGVGVFAPDSVGALAYTSLLDRLPEAEREVGRVNTVAVLDDAVYFGSGSRLLRWDGAALDTWDIGPDATTTVAGGAVYVHSPDRGLRQFVGGAFQPVPGGDVFSRPTPVAAIPALDGGIIAVTEGGLWSHDGRAFRPAPTAADGYFREHTVHPDNVARLPDGGLAVGTAAGGLVVLDADGGLRQIVDVDAGLPAPSVFDVLVDRDGGVWMGTPEGVARLGPGPVSVLDERVGLEGNVIRIQRYGGRLYLATSSGVLRLVPSEEPGRPARAVRVPGVTEGCTALLPTESGLLAGCTSGPFRVGARMERLAEVDMTYALAPVPGRPDLVWVGARGDGLVLLHREGGRWRADPPVDDVGSGVVSVLAEADGPVWLGTTTGEVVRVRDAYGAAPRVDRWDADDGLDETFWVKVWELDGRPAFGTMNGLFHYRPGRSPAFQIEPGLGLTILANARGFPNAFLIDVGPDGGVWYYGGDDLAVARPEGDDWTIDRTPVQHLDRLGAFHALTVEADGTVWLGGTPGLVRRGPGGAAAQAPYPALVRRVSTVGADSLLSGGYAPGRLASALGAEVDALRFEYGATSFVGTAPLQFRYRLVGLDEEWSPWSDEAAKEYTNLPPGAYTFEVQAEDAGAVQSTVGSLAFAIAPPWYGTAWARLAFVALALAGLVGLVAGASSWRTRRLSERADALEAAVDQRTAEVERQKVQLEAQTDQLATQADQLRELDRAKSRFFANVSHEFRTPLTLTIGPLEDLRDGMHGELGGDARETVGLALRSARRVMTLINQILDVAKLDAQSVRLQARPLGLGTTVDALADAFAPLAERLGVTLDLDRPARPVEVWADPDALDKVLSNLLSNAFKFTPGGGAVRLAVAVEAGGGDGAAPGEAVVTVADTGPGVAPEHLPHLFDRFYQADGATVHRRPGTGIGLALAHELAALHGGTLAVESEAGVGSTFTLRLPLGRDHLAPDQIAPEGAAPPEAETWSDHVDDDVEADAPPVSDPDDGEDRTTVLVVDDHAGIRAYLRRHLEGDYRVVEAADGAEALALARERLPDLVVSDVMMPVMDGVALCRALKADPATDFVPVVLLTAKAGEEATLAGLDALADDYVTKPFNVREVRARVENLIRQRRRLRDRWAGVSGDGHADEPVPPPAPPEPAGDDPERAALRAAVHEAIEAHLADEDFGVDPLAAAVGLSRSALYRQLGDGPTPAVLLRGARLARGARLLEGGAGTVAEVAYAVGFRSVSHFSRAFRDEHGVPPSAYAERSA